MKKNKLLQILAILLVCWWVYHIVSSPKTENAEANKPADAAKANSVDLTPSQLSSIKTGKVGSKIFQIEKEVTGNIAYHGKDIFPDNKLKFVVVNIPEKDSPLIHVGQSIIAKIAAYPERKFAGEVSDLGVTIYDSGGEPAIDPNTHRITARCKVIDTNNELYPGMLADVVIKVGEPVESVAVPVNAVVRKGDGTMTVLVTKDRKSFEERVVTVGLQQNDYDQIIEGLKTEELIVTDGAIFVSNILYALPSD